MLDTMRIKSCQTGQNSLNWWALTVSYGGSKLICLFNSVFLVRWIDLYNIDVFHLFTNLLPQFCWYIHVISHLWTIATPLQWHWQLAFNFYVQKCLNFCSIDSSNYFHNISIIKLVWNFLLTNIFWQIVSNIFLGVIFAIRPDYW